MLGNPALFPPPLPQQPSCLSPLLPAASCSSLFVCGGLHTQIELPFFQSVQQCPEIHPQCNFCLSSSSSWNCLVFGSLGSMGVCDDNNPPAYITPFILQALGRQSRMKFGASVRPGGYSGLIGNSSLRLGGAREPGGRAARVRGQAFLAPVAARSGEIRTMTLAFRRKAVPLPPSLCCSAGCQCPERVLWRRF